MQQESAAEICTEHDAQLHADCQVWTQEAVAADVCSDWSVARMTSGTVSRGTGSGAGSGVSLMKVKIGGSC